MDPSLRKNLIRIHNSITIDIDKEVAEAIDIEGYRVREAGLYYRNIEDNASDPV